MEEQELILKDGAYAIWKVANINLYAFAHFLSNDVGSDLVEMYRAWIVNDKELNECGSEVELEKKDGNIIIRSRYARDLNLEDGESLTITKENFIKILEQWEQLNKTKPQRITIFKSKNGLTLEAGTFDREFIEFSLGLGDYSGGCQFCSSAMCNLAVFFSGDYYLYGYDFLVDWANDPEQDGTNANITYLEKKNGIVSIGDLLDKEPRETFDLPLEQFIKLLNEWERVTKQRPKEIIITKNKHTITVKGRDEPIKCKKVVRKG